MHVCMYVCMHAFMYVCMHVCIYVNMKVCMHVCMYPCVSVCVYVFVSVCVDECVYVCLSICAPACKRASMHVGIFQQHADSFPIAQAPSTLHVDASITCDAPAPSCAKGVLRGSGAAAHATRYLRPWDAQPMYVWMRVCLFVCLSICILCVYVCTSCACMYVYPAHRPSLLGGDLTLDMLGDSVRSG